jgi:xanthine dehydrogenase accessory factor
MNDVLEAIETWRARGEGVALATVVKALGSSPRQVGAKMAVGSGGGIAGSVSGGCVEGAVFEECQEALASGQAKLLHFGVADETAWEVGLACGGTIDVFVEPLHTLYPAMQGAIAAQRPLASATLIAGPASVGAKLLVWPDGTTSGSLDSSLPREAIVADALAQLAAGENRVRAYNTNVGEFGVFVEALLPPPTLFIVGAVHIASALVSLAKVLDFRCVVIDARAAFATDERFPHADELVEAWPDEALEGRLSASSYVAVLTHDPKLDDPALKVALASPARYIGALGSTKTHTRRLERLSSEGLGPEQLARLHAPIGLPIGARTPQEIALSILAQIVKVMRGT